MTGDRRDADIEATSVSVGTERPASEREPLPPPIPLLLEVVEGPRAGERLALTRTRTVLGRTGCDFNFPDDKLISRKHAAVEVYNANYVLVRDLASTNGTFLNGFLVTQSRVAEGDLISLGSVKLRLLVGRGS